VEKMTNEQKNFIDILKPIIEKYAGGNYCVECILAQAILESAWGKSQLAKKYNNFFGMKAGRGWKGEKAELSTKEEINGELFTVTGSFRAYPDIESGIAGYFDFIKSKRYANLKEARNYVDYATKLKDDGWATSSGYTKSLINIVVTYLINGGETPTAPDKSFLNNDFNVIAGYVIKGYYGNGYNVRSNNIYNDIQYIVNCIVSRKNVELSNDLKKALYNVACDVIKGKYGNGSVNRRAKIYDNVRKAVNNLMKG
jgi:hypothetical protein